MTIAQLYPPIAAATVVNIFLFAGVWRANQIETRSGREPWWISPAIILYCLPFAAFIYYSQDRQLSGYLDYFCTAMIAEAMAVAITHFIIRALFLTRGRPLKERMITGTVAILFVGLLLAGIFTA